jgi:hypothetical protein
MARDTSLQGTWQITNTGFQGDGPWWYRLLGEEDLATTLQTMAQVKSYAGGRVDSVTLQPCLDPSQASQDRRMGGTWELPDGTWTYAGIFDGSFFQGCTFVRAHVRRPRRRRDSSTRRRIPAHGPQGCVPSGR